MKNKKSILGYSILLFFTTLILLTIMWGNKNFSVQSISQIIFHIKAPMEGSDVGVYFDWIFKCLGSSLLISITIVYVCLILSSKKNFKIYFFVKNYRIVSKVYFLVVMILALLNYKIFDFIGQLTSDDVFYETYYVDPLSVDINFPEEKRNIIHIYLESVETTYLNVADGGAMDFDKIPELTQLAKEYINFSNGDLLGGSLTVEGTQWTIASMVGQSAGIPLSLPLDLTDYSGRILLSGAYTLGELLEEQGYNQVLMKGSDADFGFTSNFYSQSNHEIIDINVMKELELIPEDYKVFWGVEDVKVLSFAKDKIIELSMLDDPFHFEIVTVDTHAPNGYTCDECDDEFDDVYDNVLACQSNQIYNFISWIQEQDFYENTTIIINGDHNNMSAEYFYNVDKNYVRTPYNVVINSVIEPVSSNNRQFCVLDWYPTILASIGVTIEGDRLGLGTNLYSKEKTLIEKYGFDFINSKLQLKSNFYSEFLLENKEDE